MRHAARTDADAGGRQYSISSDDGAISFLIWRGVNAAYVERHQPLAGIGKLSHVMCFDALEAFDRAYDADQMRYKYPLLYSQLRRAVAEVLQR